MAVKTTYFFGSYSSSIATDKYFPLRNTSVNPVYQNTGNTGQVINGQTYTFVPNDGLYFDNPPTIFTNLLRGSSVNDSDISLWDVSNIINMSYMFYLATGLNLDVDFTSSYNNTDISGFMFGVHSIHNVILDCSSVVSTGVAGNTQPFGPQNDSSNANIELHNLSVDIWFNNNNARDNLTSGVTFYNMILTFDHSASAIITMTAIQKSNLLSYLQANVNPTYTTLQDWLTDIGSNWTIA